MMKHQHELGPERKWMIATPPTAAGFRVFAPETRG